MNYIKIRDLTIDKKGHYGIGASSSTYNQEYPQYLRITDINDSGYAPQRLSTSIDVNYYPDWKKYLLHKYDIVFARTGNSTGRNFMFINDNIPTVFAGFLIKFSIDKKKINPRYLAYYCQSKSYWNQVKSLFTGSTRNNINAEQYSELKIPIYDLRLQQHIVNTIGSVDDLIENYNKKIEKLMNLGLTKINLLNNKKDKIDLSLIAKFEKGNEVGSSNYHDYYKNNFTNYIRVGDLISLSNTYVDKNICNKFAKEEDILIAMDGAPGRNTIGLKGSYSSGLYKIICNKDKKGLVYFELNSYLNQNIIKDMSQGTTILHASKSIPLLKTIELNECDNEYFNNIFNEIIILKKKVFLLKNIKEKLLIKYFTNQ